MRTAKVPDPPPMSSPIRTEPGGDADASTSSMEKSSGLFSFLPLAVALSQRRRSRPARSKQSLQSSKRGERARSTRQRKDLHV